MAERTEYGQARHQQDDHPTAEACADQENPREVYQDVESGSLIYVGVNSRNGGGGGGGIRQFL
jgi:hypothetical protein